MKVRALRNFMMNDFKRGAYIARAKDSEFEMDQTQEKEAEELYDLIMMGRVTVIDAAFVPEEQEYVGIHQIIFKREDGTSRRIDPGDKIKLSQEIGLKLTVSGHVRPSDEHAWTPSQLIAPTQAGGVIKKMFDDPLPEKKKNWVMDSLRRE